VRELVNYNQDETIFRICFFFFFSSRRRHTRWPRDWSSDVCSSDLEIGDEVDGDRVRHEINNEERNHQHPEDRHPHKRAERQTRRSEERRVGKECRSRWSPDHEKKKKKLRDGSRQRQSVVVRK